MPPRHSAPRLTRPVQNCRNHQHVKRGRVFSLGPFFLLRHFQNEQKLEGCVASIRSIALMNGRVLERPNRTVSKTVVVNSHRGFKSHLFRQCGPAFAGPFCFSRNERMLSRLCRQRGQRSLAYRIAQERQVSALSLALAL